MHFSKGDLIRIVERASTIRERLGPNFYVDRSQENGTSGNRLAKWSRVVAEGAQKRFEMRLAWDGLDTVRAHRILDTVRLVEDHCLPGWVETLAEGMKAAALTSGKSSAEDGEVRRYLDPEQPLAFEELFVPFVDVASQKLAAQTGAHYNLFSEKAHADLERSLLQRLSLLSSQSLELEFSIFVASKRSTFAIFLDQLQDAPTQEQYKAFVENLFAEKLPAFLKEYAMLARLIAKTIEFWVTANGELIQRLAADQEEIWKHFQTGKDNAQTAMGQVVEVQPNLSDAHNEGRTVTGIRFASGLGLIYKPKELRLEEVYFHLLSWINETGTLLPLKTLKLITRTSYSWVEYVEPAPCLDQEEAQRYYRRAGMLLCLLYTLEATDCHLENLIAAGEHPVLVDLETLMHHRARDLRLESGAAFLAGDMYRNSVLRTHLLPQWQMPGMEFDPSGLGGVAGQEIKLRTLKWRETNTDSMELGYAYDKFQQKNIPALNGVTLSPTDYLEDMIAGFQEMYHFLIDHREALLTTDSPLAALAGQHVRFIFRDTRVYFSILNKLLNPKFLRDGADYSIELDILSRAYLWLDSKPYFWSVLQAEKEAMENGDIPYFTTPANSDALVMNSVEVVKDYFLEPSYDLVVARLKGLNEKDLDRQIGFIRGSITTLVAGKSPGAVPPEKVDLDLEAMVPLSQEELLEQALAIAKTFQDQAIRSADGSASWLALGFLAETERYRLQPLSYELHSGSCGIALFLAAVERATGGAGFRSLALAAMQPLRERLLSGHKTSPAKIARQLGLGGVTGLGSIVYSLTKISQLLGDTESLEDARSVASLITYQSIAGDKKLDVVFGSAGAILGLLALHQCTADAGVLEQATACGQHLLQNRTVSSTGYRAWATSDEKMLTGFSHGAAGIAYSLLRLYEATQNRDFLDAAQEAFAYESSLFSPEKGNWPYLLQTTSAGKPLFWTTWCHGAPGIGLARLGGLSHLDNKEIRSEIDVALDTTQKLTLRGVDHLCCGNLGRAEVLLTAARRLSRPELMATVEKHVSWVVSRAKQTGHFSLGLSGDLSHPGFFRGTAGIGYELLRVAYPDMLPSVLLLE
jgi:type 2 lantibiotic biosynthesis protein LanM